MNPHLFLIGAWTLVITVLISKENTTRPRDDGLLHCNINSLARNRQTMGEWGGGGPDLSPHKKNISIIIKRNISAHNAACAYHVPGK